MKQVIIGDIHGRTIWREIVKANPDAKRFIFIGDYFDTKEDILPIEQLKNFEDVCQFKRENPHIEVIILIGNHEFPYWPSIYDTSTKGYQPSMKMSFEYSLYNNRDLMQMCFVDEYDTVYTHAGLTKTFIAEHLGGEFSEQAVNDLWHYKPYSFGFCLFDHSGTGDCIYQSCIWVRPLSLHRDKIDKLQVVGHTGVHKIDHPAKSLRRGFFLIDSLRNGFYLVRDDVTFEVKRVLTQKKRKHR